VPRGFAVWENELRTAVATSSCTCGMVTSRLSPEQGSRPLLSYSVVDLWKVLQGTENEVLLRSRILALLASRLCVSNPRPRD
jgi:hypothetical protein